MKTTYNQSPIFQNRANQSQSPQSYPISYGQPSMRPVQLSNAVIAQSAYQGGMMTLRCPTHPGEQFKRVCTSLGCTKQVVLCAECCYEDPDHVKLHKDLMMPIQEFLQLMDEQHRSRISSSSGRRPQELPAQIMDLAQHDEQYVRTLQTILNGERKKISEHYQAINQVCQEALEQSQNALLSELDLHYARITQSLVQFKQAVSPLSQQDNPRQQAEQALRADNNSLQAQMRSIRDKHHESGGGVLESAGSLHKCGILANRIKRSMQYPPSYGPMDKQTLVDFAGKLKVAFDELSQKLIDNISTSPDDVSSVDVFATHAISQDGLSARLPINETLVLSHQPSTLATFHKERINCITALDGGRLVTGSMDGLSMLWNVDNGELITTFAGHKGPVTCLAGFRTREENYLVSGSTDRNIILWDLEDESNTLIFKGHEDSVTTIMSLEDEQHIATGGADRKIIVWDILNGRMSCILPCNGSIYKLHRLKSSGAAQYFFSCDHSQALNLFKIEYSAINKNNVANSRSLVISLQKVILTPCLLYGVTSSLSNPMLVVGSASDRSVKVWNFAYNKEEGKFSTEKIVKEFTGHKGAIAETIIIDTQNTDDYYVITCALGDERIIVQHSRSQQPQYYAHPGLKIIEPFTSHKMQVVRNSRNEYKLVLVNQSPQNHELLLWDISDSRIL